LIDHMGRLPAHLRRSLTWDRGSEMAQHSVITAALALPVFFCDPHHPWQRGTNENTNRLLRQYLHRNADLATFTQDELNAVAAKLNHRPGRVLGWATPAEAVGATEPKPLLLAPA
jgi:IS30 family transposase